MEFKYNILNMFLIVLFVLIYPYILYGVIINVPGDILTIQGGIDSSSTGDTVLVHPGIYYENINYNGKNIVVGSLFNITGDTTYISQTIIDGMGLVTVVTFMNLEDSSAVLSGFTIQNGSPSWLWGGGIVCSNSSPSLENLTITNNSANNGYGGGICCSNSNPSLKNVTISDNSATGYWDGAGGGMYCDYSSSPSLENVTITGNLSNYGGGMYCDDSSPSLENVTITGNLSNYGGGIHCQYSSNPSLENVTITNNSATYSGGGISCSNSNPSLKNVTITNNSADRGGGIYSSHSSPSLKKVTVVGNSASSDGGGIYCRRTSGMSTPCLVNTIVSDNTGNYGIYVHSGNVYIRYSDFYNNGNGNFYNCGLEFGVNVTTNANGDSCDVYYNIQEDPLFVDPANGDYHLLWTNYPVQDSTMSPCIDAGKPDSPLDPDSTIADMGAFYFDQSLSISDENIAMLPEEFILHQNYPNPFNPITTLRYNLPEQSHVTIVIYDLMGREVKELVSGKLVSGYHKVVWDGTDSFGKPVGAGVYLYKIQSVEFSQVKKMILLK